MANQSHFLYLPEYCPCPEPHKGVHWIWTHIYIFTQKAIFLPFFSLVSCGGRLRRTQVRKPSGNPASVSPVGAPSLGKSQIARSDDLFF